LPGGPIPDSVSEVSTSAVRGTEEQVRAWINLHQAIRVIQGLLEERLRAGADLSYPEFETLMRLDLAHDHPLQMSEIATQLVGSPSGTTRLADRLEEAGLIARKTPRENRRVVQVKLTEKGRRVVERADAVFRDALHETFGAHVTDSEVTELRRVLRKLLERNGAWQDARCDPSRTMPES
jgi:DNA-binding MarR family transcriptional regulator